MADGPAAGAADGRRAGRRPARCRGSHLLPTVRGELLTRLGRTDEARAELEVAARLCGNERERAVLQRKLAEITGPFFHGTAAALEIGAELVPGFRSNYQEGRVSNHLYFTSVLETAVWGAELATALAGDPNRGRIYEVEPLGPFEDDPNVTDKKFPGNPTGSYRTRHPLRVVGEVPDWEGHAPDVLQAMLDNLARLRAQGLDVIED